MLLGRVLRQAPNCWQKGAATLLLRKDAVAFEGKLAVPMPGAAKPVLAAHEGATSSAGGIMDQEVLLHIVRQG